MVKSFSLGAGRGDSRIHEDLLEPSVNIESNFVELCIKDIIMSVIQYDKA